MKWLQFIIASLFIQTTFGQTYSFRNYNKQQGLASNNCFHISQDSKGYIWATSNFGIEKFNGQEFKHIALSSDLLGNSVFGTYIDEYDRVFFYNSSAQMGYVKNDTVYPIPASKQLADTLQKGVCFITKITNYNATHLLICTQRGFFTLDKATLAELKQIPIPAPGGFYVKLIEGKPYAAFYSIIAKNVNKDFYTFPLVIDNGKKVIKTLAEVNSTAGASVITPCLLKDGTLLIGFGYNLLVVKNDSVVENIVTPYRIINMMVAKDSSLWVNTYSEGVHYYKEGIFNQHPEKLLGNLFTLYTFEDRKGGMWITSFHQGIYYNMHKYIKNLEVKGPYCAINKNDTCIMISARSNDIYIFKKNSTTPQIIPIQHSKINHTRNITPYKNFYYLSSPGGLIKVDKNFKFIEEVFLDSNKLSVNTYKVEADKNKNLWVLRYDAIFQISGHFLTNKMELPARGSDIAFDAFNNLYVATHDGVYSLENNQFKKIHTPEVKVISLKPGPDGGIWVCTAGMGVWKIYNKKIVGHIPVFGQLCRDLCFDGDGNTWIATTDGLFKYSKEKKLVRYGMNDGLADNELYTLEVFQDKLYTTGPAGFSIIDIPQFSSQENRPQLYLESITNNNDPVNYKNEFKHTQNNFEFVLSSVYFNGANNLVYVYRLIGADTTWHSSKNKTINFNQLSPGNYTFQAKVVAENGLESKEMVEYKFTIAQPFWFTYWFIALVFGGIALGMAFISYYQIQKIRKKEEEKTRVQQLIANSKLQALQAQMNPHFIFNAINSIQRYILNNETQPAYDYLAKFSKLIRLVLSNSQQNTLSLSKELETLGLYLELEHQRFKTKFHYQVLIQDDMDTDEYEIPAMLIQPFIENAIWHGLMNLPENVLGKLIVNIKITGNQLHILIEDNGVGQEKAKQLKTKGSHQSLGSHLTIDRIHQLNGQVITTDLYSHQNEPMGTRVEIFIPLY